MTSARDLRLAPFHVLATEGAVHADKDHIWHMRHATAMCNAAVPEEQVMTCLNG